MRRRVSAPALVVVGFLLLQIAWIVTVPPFRGSDEFDHAYRAASVAEGNWVSKEPVVDGRGILVEVPESLVAAAHDQCAQLSYTGHDNCSPASETDDGNVMVGSGAATYHPAFYWVVGTLSAPWDGATRLYVMRTLSALLCALLFGAAAWSAARARGRWPLAALVLAASPVLVYSTGIVAPNGLEMCAGLALWTSLITLSSGVVEPKLERRLLWIAIVSAVVLGTLRLLGPAFIVAIVLTVALYDWLGLWSVVTRNVKQVVIGSALVAMSVANLVWWVTGPARVHSTEAAVEDASLGASYLILWPMQSIAAFPYRDQPGALIVYPVVGAMVAGLVVCSFRNSSTRKRLVVLAALVCALLLPIAATLPTMDSLGVIWQGRYGLPYGVGFVLLAGYAIAGGAERRSLPWSLTVPVAAFYGVAISACLVKVRTDELSDNPASRGDASWHAPWPVLLVALTALAMVLFLLALSKERVERGSESKAMAHVAA